MMKWRCDDADDDIRGRLENMRLRNYAKNVQLVERKALSPHRMI